MEQPAHAYDCQCLHAVGRNDKSNRHFFNHVRHDATDGSVSALYGRDWHSDSLNGDPIDDVDSAELGTKCRLALAAKHAHNLSDNRKSA
jgi:hypothetical protein